MSTNVGQIICGCGHRVSDHDVDRCRDWWRYPDVLEARQCGCRGAWKPDAQDSRHERWADQERRATR